MLKWHPEATRMIPVVVEFYREWDKCFCGHNIKNVVIMEFAKYDISNAFDIPKSIKVGVDCASIIMSHELFTLLSNKKYLTLLEKMGHYDMRVDHSLDIFKALLRTSQHKTQFLKFINFAGLSATLILCYPEVQKKLNNILTLSLEDQILLIDQMTKIKEYYKRRNNSVYGKTVQYNWDELETNLMKLPDEEMMVAETPWARKQSNDSTYKNAIGEDIPVSILRSWWYVLYYGKKLSDKQRDILKRYV